MREPASYPAPRDGHLDVGESQVVVDLFFDKMRNHQLILFLADLPPDRVNRARERKGLYAKARAGLIREFAGISDLYEPPVVGEMIDLPVEADLRVAGKS